MRARLLLFSGLTLLVFAVDQTTKAFMTRWLLPQGRVPVIDGLFDLTYVRNTGAVFGLFRDLADPWRGLLLTLIPVAAIVLVVGMATRTPRRLPLAGLGLILGGAAGNLLDRLRFGSVVDFLDFHVAGHHWPTFNAADSAICTGVALLLLDMWRAPSPRQAELQDG